MKIEVRIPDVAENVKSVLIAGILVEEGEQVEKDQPLVEVETNKATTDIPSEHDGKVLEIKVNEGDEVEVGQVIMIIESDEAEGDEDKKGEEEKEEEEEETNEENETESTVSEKKEEKESKSDQNKIEKEDGIPASPLVRKIAREKDVDLSKVEGSGPGGRIVKDDVYKVANETETKKVQPDGTELPDFAKWGNISKEKVDNIRKLTAERVTDSWNNIPQVTQYDEADMTEMNNFRNRNNDKYEKAGGKLTITAILLKIIASALHKHPRFNASIDMLNNEIIFKKYINIGVAADTAHGLIVPVIKDVDKMPLDKLSKELSEKAEKARNKKISTEELQGGNFTISNLGGIGGTNFSPIVYSPQAAILGVARSQYKQVYRKGEFEKRLILPLSLSYDHRIIDGAEAARFLRWICEVIEDPFSIFK